MKYLCFAWAWALIGPAASAVDLSAFRAAWAAERPQIEADIRSNRMSEVTVLLPEVRPGEEVEVRQVSHDFKFGSNCLVLGQLKDPAQAKAYEEALKKLFNLVTTTACLGVYEKEPGKFRFADNGDEDWRRPPMDRVAAWSAANGLACKGQPLLAGSWHPDWAKTQTVDEAHALYVDYFTRVAARYGDQYAMFDVVNEAFCHKNFPLYTNDWSFVDWALETAGPLFPTNVSLCINEYSAVNGGIRDFRGYWDRSGDYYKLAKRVLEKGLRLDGLGFQFHLFTNDEFKELLTLKRWTPQELRKNYDRYATLGVPLYITEVTIPSTLGGTREGEKLQAEVAENLYRLWFSQKAFDGITWWNLCDGAAWMKEGDVLAGLLDAEMREKPVYQMLYQLIKREWTTRLRLKVSAEGTVTFRGFHGDYLIAGEKVHIGPNDSMLTVVHSPSVWAEAMTPYPAGKKAAIAFTFDDATVDQYEDALPILEKHGVKAIFNVIPARIGTDHQGYATMSWAQLKDLVAKGHVLGNHTWHHLPLVNLINKGESDKVREEIQQGHDLILQETGYDAKVVTFPGNGVNGAIEKIVSELGYRCTPWRMDNWGGTFDSKKAAAFAEKLVREGGYKFVLMHGVRKNGGWAALNDPKQLDEIITALKANPDLYVGGFQELLEYRAKYEAWKKHERWLDEQVSRYARQAIRAKVLSSGGWKAIRKCGDRVDFEVEFAPVPTNILARVNGGKARLVVDDFGRHILAEKEVDFVPGVKYTLGGTLDQPGFLRLTVLREGLKPNFGSDWQRAVAFEPEKIVKTTPMPEDFDAFWQKARAAAAAIPLDAQCVKNEKCKLKDHDEYRVSFAAPNGRRVYGYFRKPKDASRKVPLRVQVPGAGLGSWSMWPSLPKKDEALLFMTVFPWAPWEDGNAQRAQFDKMKADIKTRYSYEAYYLAGLSDGLESEFYYSVILGIDRAITWAAEQEGIDSAKVRYYGISQGGGFGLYLTYLNPLITRAVVNVPAFADMWCGFVSGRQTTVHQTLFASTDEKVLSALQANAPYFDTANFAAKITKPIRFVTGQQDWVCPPHTVYAAYNACPSADKEMFYTSGDHNSAVEEAAGALERWLKE